METASDDWFTDFNRDGISDLATGRLPMRTAEEANHLISKILNYQENKSTSSALLVSDINDSFDFEKASGRLRELLPSSMRVEELKRGELDAGARLGDALRRTKAAISDADIRRTWVLLGDPTMRLR